MARKASIIPTRNAFLKFALMFSGAVIAHQVIVRPIAKQVPYIGPRLD